MNKKWLKKIASGFVIGCLALSFGSLALAEPPQEPQTNTNCITPGDKPTPMDMERHVSSKLSKLVLDGTITNEQANKIVSFFKEKQAEHQADMEKVKNMSQEDRRAYFHQKFQQHHDFIGDLKAAAGLSDEQAKAVANALRPPRFHLNINAISEKLNALVNDNTIAQDQADKVVAFLKEKEAQHEADMEKVKDMSPEDRQAYFHQKFQQHHDFIGDLKAAAGLSDEQAKAVADTIRPPHTPHPEKP